MESSRDPCNFRTRMGCGISGRLFATELLGQSEIELRVFELLTRGLEEGSEELERMKLTAWALEDLSDSMRINFKVLENERQVLPDQWSP